MGQHLQPCFLSRSVNMYYLYCSRTDVPIVHITPSKSPYITAVGPDFLLHCSADGNPSPTVQWYKSGQPFTAMSLKSSQDVYVPRSSATDSALYECVATNYAGNKKEQRKNHIDFQGITYTIYVHACHIIMETYSLIKHSYN